MLLYNLDLILNAHQKAVEGIEKQSGAELIGKDVLLEKLSKFVEHRKAMATLIDAMNTLFREEDIDNKCFTHLLSTMRSMLEFERYSRNEANYQLLFGKTGLLRNFLRVHKLKLKNIGLPHLGLLLENHKSALESDFAKIQKQVDADDESGRFYAIRLRNKWGDVTFIVLKGSNFMRATEFSQVLKWNGGSFPTKVKDWLMLIHDKVVPLFAPRKSVVRFADDTAVKSGNPYLKQANAPVISGEVKKKNKGNGGVLVRNPYAEYKQAKILKQVRNAVPRRHWKRAQSARRFI